MFDGQGSQVSQASQSSRWELFLLRLRYLDGRIVTLEGNEPILLTDPDTVWLVYNGQVDVFAAPFQEGLPVGARHHLFRKDYGKALFGMALSRRPVGLLVSTAPDTELLKVSRATIEELGTDPEFIDLVAELVDGWVDDLFAAVGQRLLPREYSELEPGKELTLPTNGIARVRKGVVWISHLEGRSLLNSRNDIPALTITDIVPVSPSNWLQAMAPTKLYARSTRSILEAKALRTDLDRFHVLALECVSRNILRQEDTDRQRLESKDSTDRSHIERAFARLASILNPEQRAGSLAIDGESTLLAACRLVGTAAGITMHPHPDTQAGKEQRDPLRNIAQASRVRYRQVALRGKWWMVDSGPMLGSIEATKEPVALLPASPRSYMLHNPATGAKTLVNEKVAETLSPFANSFYRPFPTRPLTGLDLLRFGMRGSQRDIVSVILMGIAAGLLGTLAPVITGILFDSIIPSAQRSQLVQIGIILAASSVAAVTFQVVRGIAVLRIEGRGDNAIQSAVMDRLLDLPATFFRDYSAGDLGVRVMGISAIRQILSRVAISAIISAIISLFNLALLFFYDGQLALIAIALVLIYAAVVVGFGLAQVRYERALADLQGKISGTVLQFINGIAKFRVAGAERRAFAFWASLFTEQRMLAFQARSVSNALSVFGALFPVVTSIVIFGVIALSTTGLRLTTGGFLAFNFAFGQFLYSALSLTSAFTTTLRVVPIFERARPIIETLPEVDEARADPGELSGEIEMSSIFFRYRADSPVVLTDVSLHIDPGQFVALVGPSGSGKSSLLRLLLGFEQPESGAVFYDRQELGGLDLRSVRRQIGVVLQNGRVMTGDIFSNIIGSAPLTIEDAWEAARMAGFEDDIKQMPMGMQTVVSEGGSTLSGGQRQRLLIARAIVSKPRIIFFDEATSALDNRTQETVSRSLEALEATRVVIAHRLSTIIHAHKIFVVEAGQIVQSGSYDQLINERGTFAELARRQLA